jgi:hypothetical protein
VSLDRLLHSVRIASSSRIESELENPGNKFSIHVVLNTIDHDFQHDLVFEDRMKLSEAYRLMYEWIDTQVLYIMECFDTADFTLPPHNERVTPFHEATSE